LIQTKSGEMQLNVFRHLIWATPAFNTETDFCRLVYNHTAKSQTIWQFYNYI
jgi:hypothetical protein